MENNYWYIGQKVSDQRYGDGIVVDIDFIGSYPIKVDFSDDSQTYTLDGKSDRQDKFPLLSQNPHVPLEYKKINKIFKKGEVVLFKPNSRNRYIGFYDSFEGGCHKVMFGFEQDNSIIFEYVSDEDIELYVQ